MKMQWVACSFQAVLVSVCFAYDVDRREYHFCVFLKSFLSFLFTFFRPTVVASVSYRLTALPWYHKLIKSFMFCFPLKNNSSVHTWCLRHRKSERTRQARRTNRISYITLTGRTGEITELICQATSIRRSDHAWKEIICNWNIVSPFTSSHVI